MNTKIRLARYCYFMSFVTLIPLICMIVACFSPVLFYFYDIRNIGLDSEGYSLFIATTTDADPNTLKPWQAGIGTVLDTLPIVCVTYAFYHLQQLFICYSRSHYFSVKAAKHCFYFGLSLVLWVFLGIIFEPFLSAALSYYSPQGRYFSFSLTSENIITLFPAISIMIIGQILKKATEIAEENNQFI